jgi:CRP-like cAMP-binding protein
MEAGALGKVYRNGETILRQGEVGDCLYVIQSGRVEVLHERDGKAVQLVVLGEGETFGEIALLERGTRSATVRALGEVRVLTLDKRTILRRIHEDPSLVFRTMQGMARRIRELSAELARIKHADQ